VDVQRRQADEGEQLEELGLPVLEGRLTERGEEVAELDRFAVGGLVVGELLPLGDRLTDPRGEEQRDQGEAEPELAEQAAAFAAFVADAAHRGGDQPSQRTDRDQRCDHHHHRTHVEPFLAVGRGARVG